MENAIGAAVGFILFFVLFFGFVTIPAGVSAAPVVLTLGFITGLAGFVVQVVANCIFASEE